MDDEPEVIRHQMAATRSSLTDKIERLEQTVTDKVESTTAAVTDTVASVKEAVQDTVNTVTGSVHDTVDSVRHTMADTVESVKETFDVPRYFREYPWAAFGAAVAAGFTGGVVLTPAGNRMPRLQSRGRPFFATPPSSSNGEGREQQRVSAPASSAPSSEPATSGWTSGIAAKFGPELEKVKGVALGAVFGLVRDWLGRSASGPIGERLGEVIDDVTRKFGGEPFAHNLLDSLTGNGGKPHERDVGSEARSGARTTAGR
jgi:ElaB/YqjD/DUF883 family membrane-anchored ribosome-binding protein